MMRVLCIALPRKAEREVKIRVGEVYEVYETFEQYGRWWHELTVHSNVGYDIKLFLPLSEIDETEFVRNYNKELA